MAADTIYRDIGARLERHQERYGFAPKELPVTLDEWVWLGEYCSAFTAFLKGSSRLLVPTHYAGVPLRLVDTVIERDGSVIVRP